MNPPKGCWIQRLRVGDAVSGFFRFGRRPRPCLRDASGEMPLRLESEIFLSSERIVWISGHVIQSNGNPMIRPLVWIPVSRWTGNPFALPVPRSASAMRLHQYLEGLPDAETRQLVSAIFSDQTLLRSFLTAPASINHHHAYPGGLAQHTCEVLETIAKLGASLSSTHYSLVMTAGFLHDIGKAYEYNRKRLTARGRWLGHEVTMLELLVPVANRVWPNGHPKRLLLFHLLTAKPAPRWTGIRHPRTHLSALLRFADRWSIEKNAADSSGFQTGAHVLSGYGESEKGERLSS